MQVRIRTLTILLTIALIGTFVQTGPVARSADDVLSSLYVAAPDPVALPPGELAPTHTMTVMLTLAEGADPDAVASAAQALGAQPLYETRLAYTGVAVSSTVAQMSQLKELEGVAELQVIPAKQRLRTRVAGRRAIIPAATAATTALTGNGVRIGIIDSGIDYTHATFGGPGVPAAFDANDPAVIEPGSFPTAKVAGGLDLAGDAYDADGAIPGSSTIPVPDADPLDCRIPVAAGTLNRGGHGTHVAATAAGFGVRAGVTYSGPYGPTLDTSDFDLAPGVAPQATLYAYKVFGCRGSTTLLGQAISLAIDPNSDGDTSDRQVDVLNISIGSPFGGDDDPDAQAVNAAVAAGVVVVVAIGDSGNSFFISSSPGTATGAVTVGGIGTTDLASFSSRGPQRGNIAPKPDLVAPALAIMSAAAGTGNAAVTMDGTSSAAAQVTGAAALAIGRFPTWSPARIKAALIGTAKPLTDSTGAEYPVSLGGAGQLNLAGLNTVQVVAYADGKPSPGGLSFGGDWMAEETTLSRILTIYNNSNTRRIVRLRGTNAISQTGVRLRLPGTFELAPQSVVNIPVRMTVEPEDLAETRDIFTPAAQGLLNRYYLAEHSGAIELRNAGFARVRTAHLATYGRVAVYFDRRRLTDDMRTLDATNYEMATPGRHIVTVLPHKAALGSVPPVLTLEVNLQAGMDYTFVVAGKPDALSLVPVEITASTPEQALLQLFNGNLQGPVDIYVSGCRIATHVMPLAAVGPFPIEPGHHVIEFKRAGTDKTIAIVNIDVGAGDTALAGAAMPALRDDDDDHCRDSKGCDDGGDDHCRDSKGCDDDSDDHDADAACRHSGCERDSSNGSDQAAIDLTSRDDSCRSGACDPRNLGFYAISKYRQPAALSVRIPYQIFPKAASDARTTTPELLLAPGQTSLTLALDNSGARNQTLSPRGAQTALVAAFELADSSPEIAGLEAGTSAADLHYAGVTSSYPLATTVEGSALYFATASYGTWSTPNEVQFRVYLDTTGPAGVPDGIDDYVLINTSFGVISGLQPNDAFVSLLYRIQPDGSIVWTGNSPARYNSLPAPDLSPAVDAAPYNSSVMFQLVLARFLGLSDAQPVLRYHIETRSRNVGNYTEVVDRLPAAGKYEYRVNAAAVAPINSAIGSPNLQQRPLFVDVSGGSVTAQVNPATLAVRRQQNILLLHLHNQPGKQAEVVTVVSGDPAP